MWRANISRMKARQNTSDLKVFGQEFFLIEMWNMYEIYENSYGKRKCLSRKILQSVNEM